MKIRIGTRGSKLALWQAEYVQERLEAAGASIEIVKIETTGDKILDVTISKIGSKGVFTEEIEEQLKSGAIDIAVHSAKDMPSTLPEGFDLIAFGPREEPHDVLVSHLDNVDLDSPKLTLGTSSTRRVALLKKYYPHIKTVAVRGNLQTRIKKMKDGACDALMLAYAGAHRMNFDEMIKYAFDRTQFVPPVGQGAITIEVFDKLAEDKKKLVQNCINDATSYTAISCERSFLKEMNGGCSIPVFGFATIEEDRLSINGGIVSLDGNEMVHFDASGPLSEATAIGHKLARKVLDNGGKEILKQIRIEQE